MIIDAHCHLDLCPNPFLVAKKCEQNKIHVLSVTTTPKAWYGTKRLTVENSKIFTFLGLHPQVAHERINELELFDALLPETQYVGEIGLDGGSSFKEHWRTQLCVFRHILKSVSNAGGKILSIHSRASASAVIAELEQHRNLGTAILHWFTGDKIEIRKAIDLGCWFSVGPVMLETKHGQSIVREIPRNRVLPESDAPFVSMRRQLIMPWNMNVVYQKLSDLWGIPIQEAEEQVSENFRILHGA